MFRKLIKRIKEITEFNHESADNGKTESSSYAVGKLDGYTEVLQSMGHKVMNCYLPDDGCVRIWRVIIDGVTLVQENEIDPDSYAELRKKVELERAERSWR